MKTYTNHNDDVCISITKAPAFLHVSLSDIFRVPIEFQHKAPFSIS